MTGHTSIGALVTPPATSAGIAPEASVAVAPATTKSARPRRFQTTKVRLVANPGLRKSVNTTPGRAQADQDVADACRPGEQAGQHAVSVERQEGEADDAPGLQQRDETQVAAEHEVAEAGRAQVERDEGQHGHDHGQRDRAEQRVRARGNGAGDAGQCGECEPDRQDDTHSRLRCGAPGGVVRNG